MTSIARRALLVGLGATALSPRATRAQTRRYRIVFLTPWPAPQLNELLIAGFAERDLVAGRNIVLDFRYTDGDPQRAEGLARELVREGVDVIVTNVTATAMAARRATGVIPIVMFTSGYPVEGGLASSLARPGGNVTGMTIYAGGGMLFGKFVDLLRELLPPMRQLGVLWGYAPPSYTEKQVAPGLEEMRRAARALGVTVHVWQTGTDRDLDAALTAGARVPLEALFVTAGVIHGIPEIADRIARFALQRRLPSLSDFPGPFFRAGGVLAYSVDVKELVARTVYFVDRILKGAKPGELPIEQPTRYELTVNLKTAKALGVVVPPAMLLRADRVLE